MTQESLRLSLREFLRASAGLMLVAMLDLLQATSGASTVLSGFLATDLGIDTFGETGGDTSENGLAKSWKDRTEESGVPASRPCE